MRWPLTFAVLALSLPLAGCFGPDTQGAQVEHFELDSARTRMTLRETVVIPDGGDGEGRPLLVFLHGRDGDEDSAIDDPLFEGLASAGDRAPVVVFPDGDKDKYWHDRAAGGWGSYVIRELIPAVQKRYGTDPRRVAIGGISMGGFGAYDIARTHPGRFCVAGGHSPALWSSGAETAPGAFDDAEDFGRHDVIAAAASGGFDRQRLWLDAGSEDPFDPGDEAFAAALRARGVRLTLHRWPGAHEGDYWNSHWPAYVRFYARALARCERRLLGS
jgi:S-formylglutathione hydrolase FrmB